LKTETNTKGGWNMGARVRHERFGQGNIEVDKGRTAIVRFDHGLEECEGTSLTLLRSVSEAMGSGEWDAALPTITKALAASIISVNEAWGVFSRSRIALLPHQLWVCRRVLSSWPARWLIADDVGLGKTIEAGLILWPLLSKGLVKRLLIVCPASLVEQWQMRLRTMFDIRIARYVAEADSPHADFWGTHPYVAASLETLRLDRANRHARLLESQNWDLLVVDEAHHLNSDEQAGPTLGYKLVQRMANEGKVASMLFFSGTPHRGKDFGFLALLSLLRPDLFSPREPLRRQLPHLREAVIRNNKQNVTDLKGKKLFSPPVVWPETYGYSPGERRFYEKLTDFIISGKAYASTLEASGGRLAVLVLIAMQKLAASSVAAIRRALRGRLERLEEERRRLENAPRARSERSRSLEDEYGRLESAESADELSRLEEALGALVTGVRLVQDEEPRLRELLVEAEAIRDETKIARILELIETRFPARSVLFFTEYKATQSLLMSELLTRFGSGCVAFINGDERADDVVCPDGQTRSFRQTKSEAAELFNAGRVRFLVSTEAGGEGIDLQESCFSLVHVDLPWNPMRLHQRVGRINRYGQTKRVEVITVRNPDTVEGKIWEKLDEKIQKIMRAFGHVMGEPEDLMEMVLGMTSPALFRELYADAVEVPTDSLETWFDERTTTFGGRDVVATVKEIVGNCDKFDFESVGQEVPPVDLPDLRPFLEAMLVSNRRRPRRAEDGSLAFKTPDAWISEVGIRGSYEGLVFDRTVAGRDAVQKVVGVGHKALDEALREASANAACVAAVDAKVLASPLVVTRVSDRVTSASAPVRSVVVGVERVATGGEWKRLRDWEVIRILNRTLLALGGYRRRAELREERSVVSESVSDAVRAVERELEALDLSFRVPSVEAFAVLWPGEAVDWRPGDEGGASDELLSKELVE
jgi:superfamily II DNA or RNA helicase